MDQTHFEAGRIMKINVVVGETSSIDLMIFDKLHAYVQHTHEYDHKHIDIKFRDNIVSDSVNVRYLHLPKEIPPDLDNYDLILVGNSDEPLERFNPCMADILNKYDNSYLISNARFTKKHPLYGRNLVTDEDTDNWLQYITSRQYPQRYSLQDIAKRKKENNVYYINGQNRTVREYFFSRIREYEIPYLNKLNADDVFPEKCEINAVDFCCDEDFDFLNSVNSMFNPDGFESKSSYYDNAITVGIGGCLGKIPPGYLLFDEYYNTKCIAFPESSWFNYELAITEKALKCFTAGVIPFPVAGAGANEIYNELGYATAHDLLPDDFKFDHIADHFLRMDKAAFALDWLNKNPEIFDSESAIGIIQSNRNNLFLNPDASSLKRLYEKLKSIQIRH